MKRLFFVIFILVFTGSSVGVFAGETLDIGLLIASKGQRDIYYDVARKFEKEYPGIEVNYVVQDDKGYKPALERWLTENKGLDVLYWQAGERLYRFVRQGLIEPIDDVWAREQWGDSFTQGVKAAVSLDGKVYGLPFSYYQWGFYYDCNDRS